MVNRQICIVIGNTSSQPCGSARWRVWQHRALWNLHHKRGGGGRAASRKNVSHSDPSKVHAAQLLARLWRAEPNGAMDVIGPAKGARRSRDQNWMSCY